MQAAVGLAQLAKMPEIVRRKQQAFASYAEQLDGVIELLRPPPGSTHIPFRAVALFPTEAASHIGGFLKLKGIEPRSAFFPLHLQPCFAGVLDAGDDERFANSIYFWNHALCLPTFPGIEQAQIDWVCDSIKEFMKQEGGR